MTSTVTPQRVGLLFGAMVLSHPTHSKAYIWFLTVYIVGKYFRLWKLSVFCLLEKWGLSFLEYHWIIWSWAVGWTQLDLFPYENISLIINIGQDLQGRWQGLTFGMSSVLVRVYLLDDKGVSLICYWYWSELTRWQRTDTSKSLLC